MSGKTEDAESTVQLPHSPATFEMLLAMAGDAGRWQWKMFFLVCLGGYFMAFQHLASVFIAATPDHWCQVPGLPPNWTEEQIKEFTIPKQMREKDMKFSQCQYYVRNYSDIPMDFIPEVNSSTVEDSPLEVAPCNAWTYDRSQYQSTIVMDWDLVCSYKPLMSTIQGGYMGGMLLGALLCGPISDRFGRRKATLIGVTMFTTFSISLAFSTHVVVVLLLRILLGVSAPAIFSCPFVLVTELVGPSLRASFGIWYEIPFGLGYATLPLLAYLIRRWDYLQLSFSIPTVVMFIYFWLLPESPRWLITRCRYKDALTALKMCASTNKKTLPPDEELIDMMKALKEKEDQANETNNSGQQRKRFLLLELVTNKEMIRRTGIIYFTWFVVAMVYYGLALKAPELASNAYLVAFLAGGLEIPAYLLGNVLVNWLGRRFTYSGSFVIGGIDCLLILIIPSSISWIPATLAVAGKFIITITFAVSYLYTAELFPTVIRNAAVSYGSMFARMGSISAPYIVYLVGDNQSIIPLILFGGLALTAGILAFFLPETHKQNLNETVKQVKLTSRKTSIPVMKRRRSTSPGITFLAREDKTDAFTEETELQENNKANKTSENEV